MKSSTYGSGLTRRDFSNAFKRKALFPRGGHNQNRKSAWKQPISVLIKIIRFAFTVFLVTLQNVIINRIQISIHFKEGILVYPGELIIDRISSHTSGDASIPITLVGYIFWFTGEWAINLAEGEGESSQAAGKLI